MIRSRTSWLVVLLVVVLGALYTLHLRGQAMTDYEYEYEYKYEYEYMPDPLFGEDGGDDVDEFFGPGVSNTLCSPVGGNFCPIGQFCSLGRCYSCGDNAEWCNYCANDDPSSCGIGYSCLDDPDSDDPRIKRCGRPATPEPSCSHGGSPYAFCSAGKQCCVKGSGDPGTCLTANLLVDGECKDCTAQYCNICKNDDGCASGYVCERGVLPVPTAYPWPEPQYTDTGNYKQCHRTDDGLGRKCDTDADCDGTYFTFCTRLYFPYSYTELDGEVQNFQIGECVKAVKSCIPQDKNDPLSQGYCGYLENADGDHNPAYKNCSCDYPVDFPGSQGPMPMPFAEPVDPIFEVSMPKLINEDTGAINWELLLDMNW